jgi:hypothetical protein
MRLLILSLLFVCTISFAGWLGQNDYTHPVSISFSSASISSVWADVGSPINAVGYKRIAFPISFAIGSASNVRFRVLWQATSGATDVNYNIATVGASSVSIEPQYYEFNTDATQNSIIDFDILPVGFVQLQTQVGSEPTDRSLDATLSSVKYIMLGE